MGAVLAERGSRSVVAMVGRGFAMAAVLRPFGLGMARCGDVFVPSVVSCPFRAVISFVSVCSLWARGL